MLHLRIRGIGLLLLPALLACGAAAADTLSVSEAVRRAREVHPETQRAAAAISAARGEFWTALSPPPPAAGVEYELIPPGEGLEEYGERTFSLSQELEFPLKTVWRGRQAGRAVARARAEAQGMMLELEAAVRQAHLEAWAADERVRILEESAATAETYAEQIGRMAEAGETSPLEARRAQVEALQEGQALERARRTQAAARNRLSHWTGIELDGQALAAPPEAAAPETLAVPASNPELQALQADLEAAGHGLTLAALGWLPDLAVGYSRKRVPAEPDPDFWGLEAGVTLPLWFWLGGRGEIQTAKAQKKAAAATLEAQRLEVLTEWENQRQNFLSNRRQVQSYRESILPLAREAYDLAVRSYDLGEIDYLEVLHAERSLLETRLEYLDSVVETQSGRIALDRLAGVSLADPDHE